MIAVVFACLISVQPLVATGNEKGVWFIGDRDPTVMEFDEKNRSLDFAICKRTSKETYIIQKLLKSRPACLAFHEGQLWFVSNDSRGCSVYSLFIQNKSEPTRGRTSMKWTLEIDAVPSDLVVYDGNLVVCCGDDSLILLSITGNSFKELPSLCNQPNARVVNAHGTLLAAVPCESGVTLWNLSEVGWIAGETVELQGTFTEIIEKDGIVLLVSKREQQGHILGIQRGNYVVIATFEIPKGRWSVVPSPEGVSVIGVERNGRSTVLDIGWPSGRNYESIVFTQDTSFESSIFGRFPFLLPSLLISFLLLLMVTRRANSKTSIK